jgi:hypothetical protein
MNSNGNGIVVYRYMFPFLSQILKKCLEEVPVGRISRELQHMSV